MKENKVEQIVSVMEKINEDADLSGKIDRSDSAGEAYRAITEKYPLDATEEEFSTFLTNVNYISDHLAEKRELTESELDSVAGGSSGAWKKIKKIFKVASSVKTIVSFGSIATDALMLLTGNPVSLVMAVRDAVDIKEVVDTGKDICSHKKKKS